MNTTSIYDFKVQTLDNQELNLSSLKGKVILIVNTASKCGFTPQYTELEKLYQRYKEQGLIILGFPCNQFGNQEPGDAEQIQQFCSLNYDVSFPMMAKIQVNGQDADPLYQYLKHRAKGIFGSSSIKWNFTKFLINRDGSVVVRYSPLIKPLRFEIGIQSLLNE